MSMEQALAGIAAAFSAALGGPYHAAIASWPGVPVKDDGGSIITPGVPIAKPCQVQVDSTTEAMRQEAGFRDTDVRLLVLAATLDADLDTDATVQVTEGPHVGSYSVQTCFRESFGIYWECRGRAA